MWLAVLTLDELLSVLDTNNSISKSSVTFGGGAVRLLAVPLCTVSSLLACLLVTS